MSADSPVKTPPVLTAEEQWEAMTSKQREAWVAVNVYGYTPKHVPAWSMGLGSGDAVTPNAFPSRDCTLFYLGDFPRYSTDYGSENNMFWRDPADQRKGCLDYLPNWTTDFDSAQDVLWYIGQNWAPERLATFDRHLSELVPGTVREVIASLAFEPSPIAKAAFLSLPTATPEIAES